MMKSEKTPQEKRLETQRVFEYCMYMMLSSYFKASKCKNKLLETQMYIRYKEYNLKKVYEMEEQAIRIVETRILPNIPIQCLDEVANVRLIRNRQDDSTDIEIQAGDFSFRISCKYAGRQSEITCKEIPGC